MSEAAKLSDFIALRSIFTPRHWPIATLAAAAAALAIAHASEAFGLIPCPLCLTQRTVYWAAIMIALIGLAAKPAIPAPALCFVLGLVYLVGAGIAFYHAGVEWGVFAAPDACAGAGGFSAIDLDALSGPMRVVSCAEAPFRFAGLSMAGWNGLFSLGLAGAGFVAARRSRT